MYSVYDFGRMIADDVRMNAYAAAIQATVRPGAVVLDIGSGPGIMSLLACRAGARKVYAVEVGHVIALAEDIARANGLHDRIAFIQAKSTAITLPERADVIVSDLRGVLPFLSEHIPSIVDARRRHLAPEGRLISARDRLWLAAAEAPAEYARYTAPWDARPFGFDMAAGRQLLTNAWERRCLRREQLLTEPALWATLDYATIESPDVRAQVTLAASRRGVVHALHAWFDAEMCDGISYSNAPGLPETVYGAALFPLPEPVELDAGDQLMVDMRFDLVGSDYVSTWATSVLAPGASAPRAAFKQSTFFGWPMPIEKVRKRAVGHRPRRSREAEVDATVLAAMTGQQPVEAIVADVMSRFPERFRHRAAALAHVGDLSERYSE